MIDHREIPVAFQQALESADVNRDDPWPLDDPPRRTVQFEVVLPKASIPGSTESP